MHQTTRLCSHLRRGGAENPKPYWLETLNPNPRRAQVAHSPNGLGPDLQSLLIRPVQRIPRYTLLLKELLGKTPQDHVDHTYEDCVCLRVRACVRACGLICSCERSATLRTL